MPKLRFVHLQNFLRSLQNATPVIAFFLIGFVLVYGIFGMQYVCVVSVVTVFFQTWNFLSPALFCGVRRKKSAVRYVFHPASAVFLSDCGRYVEGQAGRLL